MTESFDGQALHALAAELYPICRSITGDGVRATFRILGARVPLKITEVPSGAQVFDWEVPLEWNIEDAWIKDPDGRPVVEFGRHNLHVVSYSEPVHTRVDFAELVQRLTTLPSQPDVIPYRTSYYRRDWGFCLRHRDLEGWRPGQYEARVRSSLAPGSLTYAEFLLPGRSRDEVLFFTHVCHPSLANDNASGMAIATKLAAWLASEPRRYSYRVVFAPGTIGSLCWLKNNERILGRVRHGLVIGLLGDPAPFTYKKSRSGANEIDRIVPFVLRELDPQSRTMEFEPYGYDERQLCSPGFDLPVGRLTRSINDGYTQYHTSADDLSLITPEKLGASLEALQRVVAVIEADRRYVNKSPKGEPRLGKRGLYGPTGGTSPADNERAMLWVLSQSDGHASLLDIAARSGLPFDTIAHAAQRLAATDLLETKEPPVERRAGKRPLRSKPRTRSKRGRSK